MAAKTVRVVVEISPSEVVLSLTDAGGIRIEHEKFTIDPGRQPDLSPPGVGRDVFNLLYQCASDAMHGGSDGIPGDS